MTGPSAEQIARFDASNQVSDVLELPSQLEDALWRVESSGVERRPELAGAGSAPLLVCGMGGSAIGGDLAVAALGDRLGRPLVTVRGYELPPWATADSVVLCASYSGNTEETLACYEAAGALGSPRVAITTGGRLADAARSDRVPVIGVPAGRQPRTAAAYMLVSTLEVAAFAGVAPRIRDEVEACVAPLGKLAAEWAPASDDGNLAKDIAARLHGACACVYGADLTGAVAYRWKTQINENGKQPAFAAVLPEADHNEIVGWQAAAEVGRFAAVFLADSGQHPRTRRRFELTAELIAAGAAEIVTVDSRGSAPVERLMSLVLLGDLVSVYLGVLRELDPSPVPVIEQLKAALA